MYIVIFNPMKDTHCDTMVKHLIKRDIPYKELGCPLENDYALMDGNLYYNGELIDGVCGAYYRSVMTNDSAGLFGENKELKYTDEIQFSARSNVVNSWLSLIEQEGITVINPPRNNAKYRQLYLLQQAEILLPKTCITSSKEIAQQFISEVGRVVCKPLLGGSYCRRVPLEQLDLISAEPTIFQEEIDGVDIRVNILNGRVLSAHIIKSAEGVLDYRTDPRYSDGNIQYEEVSLPEEVVEYCKRAANIMELRFSGIDLRRTPNGEYFLIECNSMPAFLDIERKTGAAITDAIINDLLESNAMAEKFDIEKIKLNFQPKKDYFRGKTLFDYYHVMKDYLSQTKQSEGKRMIIRLNEKQRLEYQKSTGKEASIVEIEVNDKEVAKIIRVIS